ncbi:MAG TPA: metal ABC transporter substrate-binding protein [Lactobacillus sp.]|nr:metal ABC transporter substrate-binding protein [Lactobacillus sp.]
MRHSRKLFTVIAIAAGLIFSLGIPATANASSITIGTQGTDAQIWRHISKSSAAKQAHLTIHVKEVTDSVQLNQATGDGTIPVNAFQSFSYMEAYNKENPTRKLTAVGTTYLEPMGLYSKKYKHLKSLPKGATVGIPEDPANLTRGLKLLKTAGLITLKRNFNALGNISSIKSNPRQLKFRQIDGSTGPRILSDVDAVLMSNTIAQDGGLNVLKDSLVHEKVSRETNEDVNVLAAGQKYRNNKSVKKLIKLYRNKGIQRYIKNEFHGTKVEVIKPISALKK